MSPLHCGLSVYINGLTMGWVVNPITSSKTVLGWAVALSERSLPVLPVLFSLQIPSYLNLKASSFFSCTCVCLSMCVCMHVCVNIQASQSSFRHTATQHKYSCPLAAIVYSQDQLLCLSNTEWQRLQWVVSCFWKNLLMQFGFQVDPLTN